VSLTDQDQIDHLVVDLTRELGEQIGPETVSEEVKRVYSSFYKARIRQYVPVLTAGSFERSYADPTLNPQQQSLTSAP